MRHVGRGVGRDADGAGAIPSRLQKIIRLLQVAIHWDIFYWYTEVIYLPYLPINLHSKINNSTSRLQCQWIRQSALEFHSWPVRGCHLVLPEYAYLSCVYRAIALIQEELLGRGSRKTLVFMEDSEMAEMTGLELSQYRDQQPGIQAQ